MSTVVNKSTGQIIRSAHTPDYPAKDWLINPILPDCEIKYMKVSDTKVVEMTSIEKAAVDNDLAKTAADAQEEQIRKNMILERALANAEAELIAEGKLEAK